MSEQSKERRILSYGNCLIELARSKEKFFFWAGIILMGIWTLPSDEKNGDGGKAFCLCFFFYSSLNVWRGFCFQFWVLFVCWEIFCLIRERLSSGAFYWESGKAFIFIIWYLKSKRDHLYLRLLEGEVTLG